MFLCWAFVGRVLGVCWAVGSGTCSAMGPCWAHVVPMLGLCWGILGLLPKLKLNNLIAIACQKTPRHLRCGRISVSFCTACRSRRQFLRWRTGPWLPWTTLRPRAGLSPRPRCKNAVAGASALSARVSCWDFVFSNSLLGSVSWGGALNHARWCQLLYRWFSSTSGTRLQSEEPQKTKQVLCWLLSPLWSLFSASTASCFRAVFCWIDLTCYAAQGHWSPARTSGLPREVADCWVPGGDFQLPNGFPYLRCSLNLEIFIYFFKSFFCFPDWLCGFCGFCGCVAFVAFVALHCFTMLYLSIT